jgi:hypothetical protein
MPTGCARTAGVCYTSGMTQTAALTAQPFRAFVLRNGYPLEITATPAGNGYTVTDGRTQWFSAAVFFTAAEAERAQAEVDYALDL